MNYTSLLENERKYRLSNQVEMHFNTIKSLIEITPKNQIVGLFRLLINRKSQIVMNLKKIFENIWDYDLMKGILEILDGKILYEEERMIFSDRLRIFYEKNDEKEEALNIINIPIETFCSISKEDIHKYQLNQLRLCIETGNYDLGLVLSKRLQIMDLEYFIYLLKLYQNKKKYFECTDTILKIIKNYENILETGKNLNEHENDLLGSLTKIFRDSNLELIQKLTMLGSLFSILSNHEEDFVSSKNNVNEIRSLVSEFKSSKLIYNLPKFIENTEFRGEFINAVQNHNIGVIRRFFKSISFEDFRMLVGVEFCEVEGCKIDVENRICTFEQKPSDWQVVVKNVMQKLSGE